MTFIGSKTDVERYRMRSVLGGYRGDYVTTHTREINGKRFDFTRIEWGDDTVTVSASVAGTTRTLHFWESVRRCDNGCNAPIRSTEDFCSAECWDEWHMKHRAEDYAGR
ncbi:hypothetical protein [Streptomyces phage phiScoe1]|nr:hypothetical protein [Streptomyces phage phiScoe1]